MPHPHIPILGCFAVHEFWNEFGVIVIFAVGVLIAILLRNRLPKRAAEDPPVKLFGPRFNQRSGTPQAQLRPNPVRHYASCHCLDAQYEPDEDEDEVEEQSEREPSVRRREWRELLFHTEIQDTNSDAWNSLEAYIAKVREDGSDELDPMTGIGTEKWEQIITLPKSIGTLRSVRFLSLYGSHLVRIPPEIGNMTNLEEFDPYTSRCLHWFPYEITKCRHLKRSRVSTRALYGNFKYRPPFPKLPQNSDALVPVNCSVCGSSFSQEGIRQTWISLGVATDVLPLLVHACSEKCIQSLPQPAFGYVQQPHFGGLDLKQPPTERAIVNCPSCSAPSSDIRFVGKSPSAKSYFICQACGRSFLPEDLKFTV